MYENGAVGSPAHVRERDHRRAVAARRTAIDMAVRRDTVWRVIRAAVARAETQKKGIA
jgi:hypothetical protein